MLALILSSFQKFLNMPDAVDHVLFIYRPHGFLDQGLVGVLDQPCHLLCPQGPKRVLHLRERELDGVVLR